VNGWEIAGIGLACTLVCSFWGWLAVTVVRTQAKVAELQARMDSQTKECGARLAWMRSMEQDVKKTAENTAFIRGQMEGTPA